MKIAKKRNKYCPHCKKYTPHKVSREKTGKKRGALKKGKYRKKRIDHGYRGYPYPKIEHGKKYNAKASKKLDLRFKCSVCKKQSVQKKGIRVKKFELV